VVLLQAEDFFRVADVYPLKILGVLKTMTMQRRTMMSLACALGALASTVALSTVVASPRSAAGRGQTTVIASNEVAPETRAPSTGAAPAQAPSDASGKGAEAPPEEIAFSLGLEGAPPPGGTLSLSLDDCIKRALARNTRLRAAGQEVEAAKGQLVEASATGWPVLEYTYRVAPVPTDVNDAFDKFFEGQTTMFNSIRLAIGVPLVTFGQLGSAKQMARGGLEAARINEGKARANVVYQVKQLYYGVQLAHDMIKLLNEAVEKIGNKVAQEEANADKPGLDPYDVLQLKGYRVEMERRLDEARQNLELAYEGLRIQLDLEPGTPIELDHDALEPVLATLTNETEFVDAGMTVQPEVKLLDIGVETKRLQYRLEKFKLLPKLGFGFFMEVGRTVGPISGLTLTDDYNNPFNYTRAGLGLQLQGTLDFHGAYGRIKKARAEYHKAMYDRMLARRALTLDIRKAFLEAKRAHANLSRAKKAESMARQMMFISKVNADLGIGDEQRYGDALKYVLLTRGLYFKAIFDYNLALADLEQRIGEAKYHEVVPTPDVESYDAFNGEIDDEGFITLEEEPSDVHQNQGKSNTQP
jgi:outer membrane protein TolC